MEHIIVASKTVALAFTAFFLLMQAKDLFSNPAQRAKREQETAMTDAETQETDDAGISKESMDFAATAICQMFTNKPLFPAEFDQLSMSDVLNLITMTQYVTDLCINELERRGELKFCDECKSPIIPYMSSHGVETILTREEAPAAKP